MTTSAATTYYISNLTHVCSRCGEQNLDFATQSIWELQRCSGCIESYCSSDCQASLAKTHNVICPKLKHLDGTLEKSITEALLKEFNAKQIKKSVSKDNIQKFLKKREFTVSIDDTGTINPICAYPLSEDDKLKSTAPVSSEVKTYLLVLNQLISHGEDTSDITVIVMKDSKFLGTIRLSAEFQKKMSC